eukprot:176829_1
MDKNSIRVERESQWKSRRNAPRKPQNPVANGASTERSQLVGKLAEIEKQMSKLGNERMRLREQLSKLDAKGPEPQPSRQPVPKSSSREVASPNPSVQMLERRGSLDRGKGVNAALEMELFGEKRLNPAAIDFSEYEAIPVHVTGDHIPTPSEGRAPPGHQQLAHEGARPHTVVFGRSAVVGGRCAEWRANRERGSPCALSVEAQRNQRQNAHDAARGVRTAAALQHHRLVRTPTTSGVLRDVQDLITLTT